MSLEGTKAELNAVVYGQEYNQIPDDLFIPPDALEVLLDSFSGPLDLLLYLIRKQNINILDIPMVKITEQYLQYIGFLFQRRGHQLELAADYLLMAALLIQIKSKMLLPLPVSAEEEPEVDPRMELVKQLQAYEEMKQAALSLDALPRCERDTHLIKLHTQDLPFIQVHPDVDLDDLIKVMNALLKREACMIHHEISRESLSVRDRMCKILLQLQTHKRQDLGQLYSPAEGRQGLIVSLLAILELARQALVIITQVHAFSPIYIEAN